MTQPIIETITADNTAPPAETGHSSNAAFHDLSKAYQEIATRNANDLSVSFKQLSEVKSPTEFIELQQKLIKEGVQTAVADGQHIAHLTAAVYNEAIEGVKNKITSMQKKAAVH
jgi:hypothetical protein